MEATHKAYCDEEMAETKTKKENLDTTMEKLNTKIDNWTADIARLKKARPGAIQQDGEVHFVNQI